MPTPFWIGPVFQGRLAVMPRPRGGDWLEEEVAALRKEGVDVLISLLADEEVADFRLEEEGPQCAAHGIEFLRYPVTDHSVPPFNEETAAFVHGIAARLREGKSVVVHCFAGIGRSVLMAASAMAIAGTGPDDAFAAIANARGWGVPDTEEQRRWVVAFAAARAKS